MAHRQIAGKGVRYLFFCDGVRRHGSLADAGELVHYAFAPTFGRQQLGSMAPLMKHKLGKEICRESVMLCCRAEGLAWNDDCSFRTSQQCRRRKGQSAARW